MADEARLVVELLDRGGSTGQASTSASAPGSADVAGASLAQDTHDRITAQGAGASLGSGSIASPAPKGGDPLVPAVAGLVAADPTITPKELGAALGIPDSRAEALLEASKAKPPSSPSTSPEASSGGPSMPRRGDIDWVASGLESPKLVEVPPYATVGDSAKPAPGDINWVQSGLASPSPPPEQSPTYQRGTVSDSPTFGVIEGLGKDASRQMEQLGLAQAPKTAADVAMEAEVVTGRVATPKEAQQAVNLAAGVASQFGSIGGAVAGVAQTGAAIPGVLPALATAMGPITPALPYVGAVLAAAAVPAVVAAAGVNELERARLLSGSFSPDLAAAEAEADVRQLQANIRTAQTLGDEAADFVESRSRFNAALQGVRDIASEPLLQDFNRALRLLAEIAEGINLLVGDKKEPIQVAIRDGFYQMLNGMGVPINSQLAQLIRKFDDWRTKADRDALSKDNPLRFYLDKPMPAWPAPFNEVGEGRPIQGAEFAPIPGLNL